MSDEDTGDETDLVKKLRADLKRMSKERDEAVEVAKEGAAATRREVFREAGVPDSAFKLMDAAAGSLDTVDVDSVRALAEEAGLITEPSPTAGIGEQEAHESIAAAAGEAPAVPDGIAEQIAQASTPEEVLALAEQAGMPRVTQ